MSGLDILKRNMALKHRIAHLQARQNALISSGETINLLLKGFEEAPDWEEEFTFLETVSNDSDLMEFLFLEVLRLRTELELKNDG